MSGGHNENQNSKGLIKCTYVGPIVNSCLEPKILILSLK